jgi:iron-sulfur cluster assembly protein
MSNFFTDKILPITITPVAASEIKKLMVDKNLVGEYGLRVGIKGGGCGGASFLLGFDKRKEPDEAFVIDEIPVYVDRKHTMYLLGLEIDFEDGENGRGFTFNNPEVPRPDNA